VVTNAVSLLSSAQNTDGGWGWTKGRNSTTECTSLAVLALASSRDNKETAAIRSGVNWLLNRQNLDGSWPLSDSFRADSWATPIAMLALGAWTEYESQVVKAGKWVLTQQGNKPGFLANLLLMLLFKKKPVILNEDLLGWPWMAGTFSWVEPTSYCLIALKRIRRRLIGTNVDERIEQGESMIYDRMCAGGGWNYGNSIVYGEKLWPYADTTAIALIALQNRQNAEKIQGSFAALENALSTGESGLALSWSVLCYELYGRDSANLKKRLIRGLETTGFLGECKSLALYILALADGAKYFRI
jgi:Squalene-hopene cyclase C-terminal domain